MAKHWLPRSARTRILVVGDDPQVADVLTAGFLFQGQRATVVQAADGKTGIRALAERPPELVVLDLALPDRSGFEVLREIRSFSDVLVILLTTRNSESNGVRGLELGADAYVVKPLSPLAFLARVRALLRRAGMEPDATNRSR